MEQQDFVVGVVDLVDVDGVGKKAGEEDRPTSSRISISPICADAMHARRCTELHYASGCSLVMSWLWLVRVRA